MVFTFSLAACLGGPSDGALALHADGSLVATNWVVDHNSAQDKANATNNTSNPDQATATLTPTSTPTPASASPTPTTSAQPETSGIANTPKTATSTPDEKASYDGTLWIVGGGVALLIAAGGLAWYLKSKSR
jgi:hypothetical protein